MSEEESVSLTVSTAAVLKRSELGVMAAARVGLEVTSILLLR